MTTNIWFLCLITLKVLYFCHSVNICFTVLNCPFRDSKVFEKLPYAVFCSSLLFFFTYILAHANQWVHCDTTKTFIFQPLYCWSQTFLEQYLILKTSWIKSWIHQIKLSVKTMYWNVPDILFTLVIISWLNQRLFFLKTSLIVFDWIRWRFLALLLVLKIWQLG